MADFEDKKDDNIKNLFETLNEENIPRWAIADILSQLEDSNYNNFKENIDLGCFIDDINTSCFEESKVGYKVKLIIELREKDIPFWAISDITGYSLENIIYITRSIDSNLYGKPWLEKQTLEKLFLEDNMYISEIANLFGCHHETVKNIIDNKKIDCISKSDRTGSKKVRKLQRIDLSDPEDIINGDSSIEDILSDENIDELL